MRIVLVFLALLVVSVGGLGFLLTDMMKGGGPSIVGAVRSNSQPPQAAQQPVAAPAQPDVKPTTVAPANPQPPAPAPAPAQAATGDTIPFTIGQGDTTGVVAQHLADAGLVPSPLLFRFWVQFRGAEGKLQAGDYQLRQGMSMDELIEALQTAKEKDMAVTFIEGRRIEEFADALDKANLGIDSKRFLDLAKRGNFTYDFLESKPPSSSLEGYLFPDTYRVVPGKTTPEDLIHQMLKRFGDALTPQVREEAKANGLTIHQLVTMASIIEREAQVKEERPRISAVFYNRLRDKECICADATIQYAIGKPANWWPQLQDQAKNIAPDDPYNSYTHGGLPPGPIANPGAASLKAAAEPEKTGYRYYVRDDIKNDGSHQFATTLAEHEANIRRYQR
jgi:UPF0755 protein